MRIPDNYTNKHTSLVSVFRWQEISNLEVLYK